MKIITLNEDQFKEFSLNHKYSNYYQTVNYAKLMKDEGYDYHIVGFLNNSNEIIGASILLFKKIFMNYKMAYAPFGFLIDYSNIDLINELTNRLKKLLIKQKFIFIKLNPMIKCSERDKEGNITAYNPELNDILEIMQANDYIHFGFNNYFETEKPRWNAIVKLNKSINELHDNLNKQTRNKINKATRMGVELVEGNIDEVKEFYEFVKRKHNHNLKYYTRLLNLFGDDAKIYFAKINPDKYIENSEKLYELEEERNNKINNKLQELSRKKPNITKIINKKMESDKELALYQKDFVNASKIKTENIDGLYIGAALVIKNKKTQTIVIEGFNKEYSNFNPNYLLKWELIKKFKKEGYEVLNLNGIAGELKETHKYSGLNEMKLGFSTNIVEYIGEFNLVINKPVYNLYLSKLEKDKK